MIYDFEGFLFDKLNRIAVELDFRDEEGNPDPVNIFISEEQNFAKMKDVTPNSIYVVIKYLSSSIEFYTETMPIQILVLSEQNSFEKAQMIMNKFANENNWQVIEDSVDDKNIYIKQQYNSPVVLNNYVEVSYGYRSMLYVTGTLYIMEDYFDVTDLEYYEGLDTEQREVWTEIKPLNFNVSYAMNTNTQQLANKYIATSLKTVSTFSLTMSIPMMNNSLVENILEIIRGETKDGNDVFRFRFDCGLSNKIDKSVRLISAQIVTAPAQVPSLQLGFME